MKVKVTKRFAKIKAAFYCMTVHWSKTTLENDIHFLRKKEELPFFTKIPHFISFSIFLRLIIFELKWLRISCANISINPVKDWICLPLNLQNMYYILCLGYHIAISCRYYDWILIVIRLISINWYIYIHKWKKLLLNKDSD